MGKKGWKTIHDEGQGFNVNADIYRDKAEAMREIHWQLNYYRTEHAMGAEHTADEHGETWKLRGPKGEAVDLHLVAWDPSDASDEVTAEAIRAVVQSRMMAESERGAYRLPESWGAFHDIRDANLYISDAISRILGLSENWDDHPTAWAIDEYLDASNEAVVQLDEWLREASGLTERRSPSDR